MKKATKLNMKNVLVIFLVFLFTIFFTSIALSVVIKFERSLTDMATQTTNKLLTTPVAMSDTQ